MCDAACCPDPAATITPGGSVVLVPSGLDIDRERSTQAQDETWSGAPSYICQCPNCGYCQTTSSARWGGQVFGTLVSSAVNTMSSIYMTCDWCSISSRGWHMVPAATAHLLPKWEKATAHTQCQRCGTVNFYESAEEQTLRSSELLTQTLRSSVEHEEGTLAVWGQCVYQTASTIINTASVARGRVNEHAQRWCTSGKHHCRQCGKVVCSKCSAGKATVQGYGEDAVRVCDDCLQQIETRQLCVIIFHPSTSIYPTLVSLLRKFLALRIDGNVEVVGRSEADDHLLRCPACRQLQPASEIPKGAVDATCPACSRVCRLTGPESWQRLPEHEAFQITLRRCESKALIPISEGGPFSRHDDGLSKLVVNLLRESGKGEESLLYESSLLSEIRGGPVPRCRRLECRNCGHKQPVQNPDDLCHSCLRRHDWKEGPEGAERDSTWLTLIIEYLEDGSPEQTAAVNILARIIELVCLGVPFKRYIRSDVDGGINIRMRHGIGPEKFLGFMDNIEDLADSQELKNILSRAGALAAEAVEWSDSSNSFAEYKTRDGSTICLFGHARGGIWWTLNGRERFKGEPVHNVTVEQEDDGSWVMNAHADMLVTIGLPEDQLLRQELLDHLQGQRVTLHVT